VDSVAARAGEAGNFGELEARESGVSGGRDSIDRLVVLLFSIVEHAPSVVMHINTIATKKYD
jgi:hypothetical protein